MSAPVSVCAGDADGVLVRTRGACLVEDIDRKRVLMVRDSRKQDISVSR